MIKPYRICFLGYGRLTAIAQEAMTNLDLPDTEVLVVDCNVDNLGESVDWATAQGCEVFVGGSGNAAEFFRRAEGHLVEIRIRDRDYLLAIQKAMKLGDRLVIAAYRHSRMPNIAFYADLLGVKLELLTYEDGQELRAKMERCSADVIIGASHASEIADALGKQAVLAYPGEESIQQTIRYARMVAIERRKEKRSQAMIRAIINNSTFGIVVSDEADRIILFNRAAQRQAGILAADAMGRGMGELFPNFGTEKFRTEQRRQRDAYHLVNGAMFRCAQTKISIRNEIIGVLTTLNTDARSRRHKDTAGPTAFTAAVTFQELVAKSPVMEQLLAMSSLYAEYPSHLLIVGEEGTGQERLAQCIHNASNRRDGPYVHIDLSAIGAQDAGRFLLGCEERERVTIGLLERANNGTAVLSHLADGAVQAMWCILNVLTNHRLLRLGRAEPIPVDIRFVTIVTKEELSRIPSHALHLLDVFRLNTPALRERTPDLVALFQQLLHRQSEGERKTEDVTPQMASLLESYGWPGNLDEMETVCQRYIRALTETIKPGASVRYRLLVDAIGEERMLRDIVQRFPVLTQERPEDKEPFRQGVDTLKKMLGYSNTMVADKLGISRTTLWRMTRDDV